MPSIENQEKLVEIKKILSTNKNFVIGTYAGLNVEQLLQLRAAVREKNSRLKVVKNTLFKIALKESPEHSALVDSLAPQLKGPVVVAFVDDDLPSVAKLIKDFSEKNDKVQIKSGVMDGQYLSAAEVKDIAGLPTKEELLSIIARGLNTPAQKIAIGINEIISSLARGIKAVGEKNGG